jgi:uncharacterized tellurite resistance protein B-like protein
MNLIEKWKSLLGMSSANETNGQQYELSLINQCIKYFNHEPHPHEIESIFLAAIIARVVTCDGVIDNNEKTFLKSELERFFGINEKIKAEEITDMAIKWSKEFSQLENQVISNYFRKNYNREQNYLLLKLLFRCSAIDEEITNLESEELRLIAHSLDLSPQHFLAARAEFKEHLLSLKK